MRRTFIHSAEVWTKVCQQETLGDGQEVNEDPGQQDAETEKRTFNPEWMEQKDQYETRDGDVSTGH